MLSIFSIYLVCLIIFIIKGANPLSNKIKTKFLENDEKVDNKDEIVINDIMIPNKLNQNNKDKILSHPLKKKFLKIILIQKGGGKNPKQM